MSGLRAIMVCVDYADLLAITLPWNAHHFSEVWVGTTPEDTATQRVVASVPNARLFLSRKFHEGGASFNKWAVVEELLDQMGRHGWLCLMDADVLWPRDVGAAADAAGGLTVCRGGRFVDLAVGQLCTPLRRMLPLKTPFGPGDVPPEERWAEYPVHRNVLEWAGYSQIFHASDPALGPPPWHDVRLNNAGAADSWFQARWPVARKIRPPWEVLHLGEAGANWLGRATPYLDGTVPAGAAERREAVRQLWLTRRRRKAARLDPFAEERLPPPAAEPRASLPAGPGPGVPPSPG